MVIVAIKIERVLGDLGETPYDLFREEKDEDAIGKSCTNKQLLMLNETLIFFLKESSNRSGVGVNASRSTSKC
jgi:hypothetical protein